MFQGFSDKTIDFMWGIRFNNEKAWFEAHKEEYLTYFYNPMRELGRQVFESMTQRHGDLGLVLKVSRIYRDARRLHGRGPYKDHLWLSMERPGGEAWTSRPTFWFELAPESWSYGLGYWCAGALTMAKFRARLDRDPKPFEKLARAFNINPATAAKGINRLVEEGLLYKRRGIGMFVAPGAAEALRQKRREDFAKTQVRAFVREAKRLGLTQQELYSLVKAQAQEEQLP